MLLGVADKIVAAVTAGTLRHFFLIGGCDGAEPGRNYFSEFARMTPKDSLVLTLGCGKFRIRDESLGTFALDGVGEIPRLLDMGQCNDAYGAIQVAAGLAQAFGCGVNDLPLTIVLSWFEQKAVAVLLSLLALGVKGSGSAPTRRPSSPQRPRHPAEGVRPQAHRRSGGRPQGRADPVTIPPTAPTQKPGTCRASAGPLLTAPRFG
ncbi:Prismane, partial [sediment metagenome]